MHKCHQLTAFIPLKPKTDTQHSQTDPLFSTSTQRHEHQRVRDASFYPLFCAEGSHLFQLCDIPYLHVTHTTKGPLEILSEIGYRMRFPRWFPQVDNVAEVARLSGRAPYSLDYTNCHLFMWRCVQPWIYWGWPDRCPAVAFSNVSKRVDIESKVFQIHDWWVLLKQRFWHC